MVAASNIECPFDALMVDEDLLPEQVVLFGFSQAQCCSSHSSRREDEIAGLVAFQVDF